MSPPNPRGRLSGSRMRELRNFLDLFLIIISFYFCILAFNLSIKLDQIENFMYEIFRTPANSGGLFYEYQNVFSGVLALSAALLTCYFMHKNHQDLIRRGNLNARANMLDALDELCDYCTRCFEYIYEGQPILPKKPVSAINSIKESIKFIECKSEDAFHELVSKYQTFNSRLSAFHSLEVREKQHDSQTYKARIFDVIVLHHCILRVFSYGRMETKILERKKISSHDLHSALRQLVRGRNYLQSEQIIDNTIRHLSNYHEWNFYVRSNQVE